MRDMKNILVVCIDRDNDLGKKAGVHGPVIGRQKNLNSAAKLALADPGESDVNAIFAAVKKFDEVKGQFANCEVVTLTGHSKTGFESDRRINEQLDIVLDKFPADGFILVTDGAEDDSTIPVLQGRAPIISTEQVVIKQAREVESTYYTIKEVLRDPAIARIVFLIPGIVILLWGMLFFLQMERLFFQAISLVVGIYLILKGTGLEEWIAGSIGSITRAMSLQRVSFPFYLMTLLLFGFGLQAAYNEIVNPENITILAQAARASEQIINFAALAAGSFIVGRGIDALHFKKAFFIRRYFMYGVATFVLWSIVNSGRLVVVEELDIIGFSVNVLFAFVVALVAYFASGVLDVRKKITKLLIGLPVYDREGAWLGKVENVSRAKNTIEYRNIRSKEVVALRKKQFVLREGRVLVVG
ncbi:MAG: DUF373 family protein [Candidatus Diapherotrites archaeon]|nr:DUF373 family protein [Candidatus Micrarchaeota archaeon]MBU1939541.1 DUF373 family protein [Candidatus Micrarchaeota archaeon]